MLHCVRTVWVTIMLGATALGADAQDKSEKGGLGLWNVESMVDQAAKQIVQRYKLNDEQTVFTRQLMARRVNQLLDKHERQVRQLFSEALAMRAAGKAPTAEAIRSWAERALPIYEDAKKQILEGNEEWSQILTPEQKKTHEIDLRMMKVDFDQYEQRLNRWSKGGFDAEKDWVTQRPPTTRPMPRRSDHVASNMPSNRFRTGTPGQPTVTPPPPPPPGAVRSPAGPMRFGDTSGRTPTSGPSVSVERVVFDPEQAWDAWVSNFVRQCRLDESQATQARAILKDCKERASRHREAHRDDYVRLQARIRELQSSGAAPDALATANKELADLNAPVNELFEELKSRIEQIPTSAQLQGFREAQPSK